MTAAAIIFTTCPSAHACEGKGNVANEKEISRQRFDTFLAQVSAIKVMVKNEEEIIRIRELIVDDGIDLILFFKNEPPLNAGKVERSTWFESLKEFEYTIDA